MSVELIAGDLDPDLDLTVNEDLTDAETVEMFWKLPGSTTRTVTLEVISAAAGSVRYAWQAGDTDVTGVHRCRVVVTWDTGDPQTFPSDGSWFIWWVYPAE